jgi:hypothetical protein
MFFFLSSQYKGLPLSTD